MSPTEEARQVLSKLVRRPSLFLEYCLDNTRTWRADVMEEVSELAGLRSFPAGAFRDERATGQDSRVALRHAIPPGNLGGVLLACSCGPGVPPRRLL